MALNDKVEALISAIQTADPSAGGDGKGFIKPLLSDNLGVLFSRLSTPDGPVTEIDEETNVLSSAVMLLMGSVGYHWDNDNNRFERTTGGKATTNLGGSIQTAADARSLLYAASESNNWQLLRALSDDDTLNVANRLLGTVARLQGYDPVADEWARLDINPAGDLIVGQRSGALTFHVTTLVVGNELTLVTNQPCIVYSVGYTSLSGSTYLKLYDTAVVPVAGVGTPIATIKSRSGVSQHVDYSQGAAFNTGLGFTITGAPRDGSVGTVPADTIIDIAYKLVG